MISHEEVSHIGRLAHLHLSDEEIEYFSHQLGRIIEYVRKIDELDTTHISPTSHPIETGNPLRQDKEVPYPKKDFLKDAPLVKDGYFIVPRVIE